MRIPAPVGCSPLDGQLPQDNLVCTN